MIPTDIVISFFERVYNQKDFEYVMAIYADDYYEHTETGARSKQDCREIIMGACVAFPDLHVEVNELVAQDDIVAVLNLGVVGQFMTSYRSFKMDQIS